MLIGSKQHFEVEYDPGATAGHDEIGFWVCGRCLGKVGDHVTTEDVASLIDGALSYQGRRSNERLFATPTDQLATMLDSAF